MSAQKAIQGSQTPWDRTQEKSVPLTRGHCLREINDFLVDFRMQLLEIAILLICDMIVVN